MLKTLLLEKKSELSSLFFQAGTKTNIAQEPNHLAWELLRDINIASSR